MLFLVNTAVIVSVSTWVGYQACGWKFYLCLQKPLNARQKPLPHPLSENRKTYHVGLKTVTKPTDSNWHGWVWMHVSVCVSIWHARNVGCVCVLCSGTCDKLWARGWCLCLCLMCNRSQSVVHEVLVLFIEITAPCAAYCVCEGCDASFYLSL